jgi:hypothetical protein
MNLSDDYVGAQTEVCFELLGFRNKITGKALPARDSTATTPRNSWHFALFNIRFVLKPDDADVNGAAAAPAAVDDVHQSSSLDTVSGLSSSNSSSSSSSSAQLLELAVPLGMPDKVLTRVAPDPPQYQHLKATADLFEFERRVRAAANAADVIVGLAAPASATAAIAQHDFSSSIDGSPSSSSSSSSAGSLLNTTATSNCAKLNCSSEQVWEHLQQQHDWPDGQVVFESLFHPCETLSPGSCVEMCGND